MEEAGAGGRITSREVREASFPQARRGYDREAVHAFLDRVAQWVEDTAGGPAGGKRGLTSEFARVGERTGDILTAAEDAATKLRNDAKEYAQRLRTATDEETRKLKLNAAQKADELVAEAESKAERMIEEAIARRRRLNQAVASLLQRRDEIADEAQRLADQLLEAVESMRTEESLEVEDEVEDEDAAQVEDLPADSEADEAERARLQRAGFAPGGPGAGAQPPADERQTAIHNPDQS